MFQKKILNWYMDHQRALPWRLSHDPYRIWLSEVMLQQTQVSTVIDYFNRFIERYPTVVDMAEASEDDVLKLWEGLGYYSRARRLIPCAKMVVEEFKGEFPKNVKELLKLPGIGHYTAGAILNIAYNIKAPTVDGNVMRVYSRYFGMSDDISNPKTRLVFEEKIMATLPKDRRHFIQAIMDLGATICTPKKVTCHECPINKKCYALKNKTVDQYPVKSKKIKKVTKQLTVLKIVLEEEFVIVKRPSEGLLASMWGFPNFESEDNLLEGIAHYIDENYGFEIDEIINIKTDKHVFTHLVWEMQFVEVRIKAKKMIDYPQIKWVTDETINVYALPKAFRRLIEV